MFFRAGIGTLGVKVGNTLLLLAISVTLARILGAEKYGIYTYVLAWVTILGIPAQIGLPNLLVREIAAYQAKEQWSLISGLLRWAFQAVFILAIALVFVAALIAWEMSEHMGGEQLATFGWGLVLLPVIALGEVRGGALRGLRKVVQGLLPEKILCPAVFFLMLLGAKLLMYPAMPLTPSATMFLYVLSAAVAFVIGVWFLIRSIPPSTKKAIPKYDRMRWLASAIPLSLIAGVSLINSQTDIVMLGVFMENKDVGIYRVAIQTSALIGFGLQSINLAIAPYFSRLYASGEVTRLQRVVTASARAILAFAIPIVLALVFFGAEILNLVFGPDFTPAYGPMLILAGGCLVDAAAGSVALLLNMTGFERITARGLALTSVVNIFLNFCLIPLYGTRGAALATACSTVMWNIMLWKAVRKHVGIDSTAFAFPISRIHA